MLRGSVGVRLGRCNLPRRLKPPTAKELDGGRIVSKNIVRGEIAEPRRRSSLIGIPKGRAYAQGALVKRSTAQRECHAILLVDDDPALGFAIEDYLAEAVIEVVHVHDSVVALGMLEARREIDLLMTAIAIPKGVPCAVALMVRPLVQGVGFVFVTGRPELLDTAGNLRDKAFIKPVDLAQAICSRLAV
jgi:CheY-like chemotaxis protein